MIQALVLTHGAIGDELVKVVEMILGPVPGLTAQSNRGLSAKQLSARVADWIAGLDDAGGIVFLDDYGGSCASAALLGGAAPDRVTLIGGVNLAMLLAFVTWREDLARDELVQRIVDKGREAVTVVGAGR
jgi:mannose/fructose-specific phosphotransferase system component IIA